MPSERSQLQKFTGCMIPFPGNAKQVNPELESRLVVARGEGKGDGQ